MKRQNRRTRVPIDLYLCHIKEKMTIKEVKRESVMEWRTKVTTKDGIVIKFPRQFRGYKLAEEEEEEENEELKKVWEQDYGVLQCGHAVVTCMYYVWHGKGCGYLHVLHLAWQELWLLKFRWATVFATGRRSFIEPKSRLRMKRKNRRTRVPIDLYLCHIKEKMTIKEVKRESVMEWRTKVTTKDGIVIKFPRQFRGYKLAEEEEEEENEELKKVWEQVEFVISDSDLDLESTTSS
uniref:Uncharacterized protein n=1 Tax=Tanacetum cinerariifolium TaxID=118510 RepID=A0A699HWW3_TANCI|nr:hypothetical protein [Tanacetum cinerariifolium]